MEAYRALQELKKMTPGQAERLADQAAENNKRRARQANSQNRQQHMASQGWPTPRKRRGKASPASLLKNMMVPVVKTEIKCDRMIEARGKAPAHQCTRWAQSGSVRCKGHGAGKPQYKIKTSMMLVPQPNPPRLPGISGAR